MSNSVPIKIFGLPSMSSFSFMSKHAILYKTLLTQEMLKKGYLATTSLYTSISHTDEILNQYFDDLNDVFAIISDCEKGILDINRLLEGPHCHSGFNRLN